MTVRSSWDMRPAKTRSRLRWRRLAPAATLAAGLLLFVALAVALLVAVPRMAVQGTMSAVEAATVRSTVRASMVQLLGGIVLSVGAIVSYRTLSVTRDRHLTERFAKATEQLGGDTSAVRLGAIYSLERLAWDSFRDHGPVVELLCAFVREQAVWADAVVEKHRGGGWSRTGQIRLRHDIQAAISVIARRRWRDREDGAILDLGNCDLRGLILPRGNLSGVDLRGCHLEEADLRDTNLSGANLEYATLDRASLAGANLTSAHLWHASITVANLDEANFTGANLQSADISSSEFDDAIFRGASMDVWRAIRTNFGSADLSGVYLGDAELQGARLNHTTGLTAKQLERTKLDHTTLLPKHLAHLVPAKPEPAPSAELDTPATDSTSK